MLNLIDKSAYDRKVYKGLIATNVIPIDQVDYIFQEFYPIVLNIYDKEVDATKYVEMLKGIYLRRLSKTDVLDIVGKFETNSAKQAEYVLYKGKKINRKYIARYARIMKGKKQLVSKNLM